MRRVPWVALGLAGLGLVGWALAEILASGAMRLPPCAFKALTGLPCLSCGLTRWGLAVWAGDLPAAWAWHPGATLLAAWAPVVAGADLLRALRNRPYPPLPGGGPLRWAVAGLLALAWGLQVARGV